MVKISIFSNNLKLIGIVILVNFIIQLLLNNFPETFQAGDVLPYQLWINTVFLLIFLLPNRVADGIL